MKKVYIESSVISYITAKPSRDLIVLARQALTIEWWESKRNKYEICISELVLQEIASGDPVAAQKRIDVVSDVQNLEITLAAKELANILISEGAVPKNSLEDALHISTVAVQGVEYLLTWNFKHINNASTRSKITHVIENFGYISPILCSPEEL
jgi:hypothetical protein